MSNEFIDTCKHIGEGWNNRTGWIFPPFPPVPDDVLALAINSEASELSDWDIEDLLIDLGFTPSYRHLGLNDAKPYDPTSLVFYLRSYRKDDPQINHDIGLLLTGGIPASALLIVTHRLYCAVMGLRRDR